MFLKYISQADFCSYLFPMKFIMFSMRFPPIEVDDCSAIPTVAHVPCDANSIIETIGTGQAEVEVMRAAQTVLVVSAPGMGDEIQAIKAGILEIADIFVVSKADKPGADQTVAELAMLLSLDPHRRQHDKSKPYWRIPVLKTSAIKDQGITQLVDAIEQHYHYLVESDMLASRTQRQVRSEVEALVLHAVILALRASVTEAEWQQLMEDITTRERDPYTVAIELQKRIGLNTM